MNAIQAAEFVKSKRVKSFRAKSFRLLMRRAALCWRHAVRFEQWEAANVALQTAVHFNVLARIVEGKP